MKIRNSFVSNSSTSSFVVIGIQLDLKRYEEMGGYEFFDKKFGYVDCPEGMDVAIVGESIGRWSDDSGVNSKDLKEVAALSKKVLDTAVEVFNNDGSLNIELIYGSVYG